MKLQVIKDEKGIFTLAELLCVLVVLAFVFGAIFDLLYFGEQRWSSTSQDTEARQNGRLAIDKMIKEIREAQSPSDADYGIYKADKLEFQFYADINDNPGPERIRYYLSGDQLMRGELNPSTTEAPWEYTGVEQTAVVAKYIRNTTTSPIFKYYDKNSTELTNLPLSLADRKSIRLVKINLLVDVNTNELPDQIEIETQAQLRNLRD